MWWSCETSASPCFRNSGESISLTVAVSRGEHLVLNSESVGICKVGTKVFTTDGQAIDVAKWLASCNQEVCIPIIMGIQTPVRCFLVAAPLPEDAKIKRQARLDQRPISKQKQALAAFTIYVTNMEGLTFPQAYTLARMHWQIELLFKLWKSHVRVLHSRSADSIRQQCEGYAKLIGAIVQQLYMGRTAVRPYIS